jgi:hypothetical protein
MNTRVPDGTAIFSANVVAGSRIARTNAIALTNPLFWNIFNSPLPEPGWTSDSIESIALARNFETVLNQLFSGDMNTPYFAESNSTKGNIFPQISPQKIGLPDRTQHHNRRLHPGSLGLR